MSHFFSCVGCLGQIATTMRGAGLQTTVVQWERDTAKSWVTFNGKSDQPKALSFLEAMDIQVCFDNGVEAFANSFDLTVTKIAVYTQPQGARAVVTGAYERDSVRFVCIIKEPEDSSFTDNTVEIVTQSEGAMNAQSEDFDRRFLIWLMKSTFSGQLARAVSQY